ncbi:Hypothetical protein CGLY_16735 (plasmid) [Corynebacterium glyciniphilum AJ 3170]|uniref:Uncharacterized protein n=1 Tax=Corynebacterium glyciniphilum AJ 3170 TaxID=1404245 RepID=X5EEA6_9CORY|nr:hypothetical protein [Corynebacterium glyciniphilum]AHW65720.1 Hypothetical protein CGLY_16735 [Corynebacterium glyciniphilum AJ 3170]
MPPLKQHFGIPSTAPFVDVDTYDDTSLFVDPFRIARGARSDPYAAEAHALICDYSELLCRRLLGSVEDKACAQQMLDNLNEPSETHLGMSRTGYRGRGVGEYLATKIREALQDDLKALVAVGVFHWIGALPLFVRNFDSDRMSDVTTSIIRGVLIDFTEHMVDVYPEFRANGNQVRECKMTVWDRHQHQWIERTAVLPYVEGHPLLLIPEGWTGSHIQLHARRYHSVTVLGRVQEERLEQNPKARRIPKETLAKLPMYSEIYPTNLAVTLRAFREGINLLEALIQYVNDWMDEQERLAA